MAQTEADWREIRLTPIEDADLPLLHRWQNAPDVRDLTMGFRFPVTEEKVKDWIARHRSGNGVSSGVYGVRYAGELVGVVQLNDIDRIHRRANFGIFIGEADQRASGIGTIAASLLLDFAFNGLDLRKVSLEAVEGSTRAISLYEKLGFQLEGIRRRHYFLDGKVHDVRIYGIFREEMKILPAENANRLVANFP